MPSHDVWALTAADIQNAQQQSGRIQREQEQQQEQDTQSNLSHRPQTTIQMPAPALQKGKGEGCRNIKKVMLLDATHMSAKEEDKLTAPYAGKCLGVNEIEKLMSDVTAFYINKGYVTTRVYLPAQDLSKGTLKIQVVAGKVSEIKTDEKKSQINYLTNIFPGVEGHDLNLRDFEQGIDQINRLLSNNATIDIQPGANPGDSVVVINNNEATHWHVNSTADNYGSATTGRDEVAVTASFDNLTGLEDFTSLSEHKTLPMNERAHQSTASNAMFSVPFGYTTFTTGYNMSDYDSSLHSGNVILHLNGDDRSLYGTVDHVVYRDQTSKASVNATLTNDITMTLIDNQLITVSSRTLTYLALGANYSNQIYGGTFTLGPAYTRGLRAFNALADQSGISNAVPHAQFDKYTLSTGYTHPFSVGRQNFSASSQFSGQYAPQALYGSQQFSIGGIYTVRGFVDEALANDDGYYLRNDITWLRTATLLGHTINIKPLAALDVGSVGSFHAGTQHGTLVGAATGADVGSGPFDFNILAGHAVIRPDTVGDQGLNFLSRLSVTF